MTRPATSTKIMLIEETRGAGAGSEGGPVRRYRLARLSFASAPVDGEGRFEYLKQSYD